MLKITHNFLYLFTSLFVFSILIYSCKTSTEPDDGTTPKTYTVNVEGSVIDFSDGSVIINAVIRIRYDTVEVSTTTNAQGNYSSQIQISGSKELKIIASKEGYVSDTAVAYAIVGRTTTVPALKLKKSSTIISTGDAATITLYSQTSDFIGVKESGFTESARITFAVQDSSGKAIDINHSITVTFRKGAGPNGGEYLNPASAKTDNLGQVTTNLVSGTKAGVVQIIAEINFQSKTIISKPVSITIHGGLPDLTHFGVGPLKLNFPALGILGKQLPILAVVGDKYGNPVVPNTAVYFTTDYCLIEGSELTDNQGLAGVNFISNAPFPPDGFATITASTADENYNVITKQTRVLVTGPPNTLLINPTTFDLPKGGSQTFDYTVQDILGNPLSEGQTISVEATGDKIKTAGTTSFKMPDTQSKSLTRFSFVLMNMSLPNDSVLVDPRPVSVTIKTDGPNGPAETTITGIAR